MRAPDVLFQHSAEYRESGGAYGNYGDWQEIENCYVQYKRQMVRNDEGDEILSEATVFLPSDADEIPPGSELRYGGDVRSVISCRTYTTPFGQVNHIEVVLK